MIVSEISSGFSKMQKQSNQVPAHQIVVNIHILDAADYFRRIISKIPRVYTISWSVGHITYIEDCLLETTHAFTLRPMAQSVKNPQTGALSKISWKIRWKVLGGWVHHDRDLPLVANEGFLGVIEVNLWNTWRVVDDWWLLSRNSVESRPESH